MSVNFKKYQPKDKSEGPIRAIRLTENNIPKVADYINRNGGKAEIYRRKDGTLCISVRQRTHGKDRARWGYRVAVPGDFVTMVVLAVFNKGKLKNDLEREFARVKEDHFEASHERVK